MNLKVINKLTVYKDFCYEEGTIKVTSILEALQITDYKLLPRKITNKTILSKKKLSSFFYSAI